jgi:hypothetical protein
MVEVPILESLHRLQNRVNCILLFVANRVCWRQDEVGGLRDYSSLHDGCASVDSADVAGACSAAKFVVEGAGEEYDARLTRLANGA